LNDEASLLQLESKKPSGYEDLKRWKEKQKRMEEAKGKKSTLKTDTRPN
jgi:hypothetical protein